MQLKKFLSVCLAAAMVLNTGTMDIMAAGTESGRAASQAVSAPETVYVDSYGTSKERSVSFNDHWRFYLGEVNGAQDPSYNDASWERVDLPHDYSIDQGFSTAAPAEQESGYVLGGTGWYRKTFTLPAEVEGKVVSVDFDGVYMNAAVYLNGEQLGTHPYGYTPFSFVLPADKLKFGGEENVLAVKVDHKQSSSRWYSGSGIYRDVRLTVTDSVHVSYFGTTVTTPDIKSEYKDGTGTVQVAASITNDSTETKSVSVLQKVYEKGAAEPVATGEKTAPQSIAAGAEQKIESAVSVQNPKLWSVEEPNLYTVRTEVYVGEKLVDSYDTEFGFRWVEFTKDNGFFLNGENMKLKGVSMHHDQGGLGSESWHRAVERQVEKLQQMGVNAIRVTHNPASQTLIDICNEKGMLLVEEAFDCWLSGKAGNTEDYGKWFEKEIEAGNQIVGATENEKWAEFDLKAMVKRGRNAPSIIMWSLGNEVFQQLIDTSMNSRFPETAKNLITWTGEEDATRYVTFGDNQVKGNVWADNPQVKTAEEFAKADQYGVPGGLVGFNYGGASQIQNGHSRDWLVYGSETASSINSRGVYDRKNNGGDGGKGDKRLTSYDKSCVSWGHLASAGLWITMNQEFNAGEFVWTGFDYIGEPTPDNWQGTGANGTWPNIAKNSYFGIIDTAGFPKDSFYLYQSQWNDKVNTLHVLPVWNRDEIVVDNSGKAEVVVYSDAPVVKLYLNGEEVGTATAAYTETPTGGFWTYTKGTGCFAAGSGHTSLYATFQVPYAEGKLEAKAFDAEGNEITKTDGRRVVETTKQASKLTAEADRAKITADGKDLSYITIDVADQDGKFVNGAEPEISVSVEGDGKLLALDNGLQNDVTSYGESTRKAGKGKLLAIVQSTKKAGTFTVSAKAQGLTPASVEVTTEAESTEPVEKNVASYEISRHYYVQNTSQLQLPGTVKVNYTDGSSEEKSVSWDTLPGEQKTLYEVYGTVADVGLRIPVYVSVIESVAAVLNYSAAVGKGSEFSLPESRPAVMADGTILSAEFPVTWNGTVDTSVTGIQEIKGTAEIFGDSIDVNASVRVTAGGYRDGDEALPNVPEMYINEISSNERDGVAEVLKKLKDDKTAKEDVAWSGRGTLDFRLDTAIDLKDITLYLKDTAPTSGTMKIYSSSNSGETWNEADCEISNKRANGVTIRTFTPKKTVSETYFRVEFTKNTTLLELELNTKIPTFSVGEDAALSYVKAGVRIADNATLEKGWFGVEDADLDEKSLKVSGKDNASYTILPKDAEGIVRIILESEDHSARGVYQVHFGKSNLAGDNDNAADDSLDYPYQKMTLTAASWHKEEPPASANDGNDSTKWHSNWGNDTSTGPTNLADSSAKRYLQMELDSVQTINALRYLPRSSDKNGIVLKYQIKASQENLEDSAWQSLEAVAEGNWNTAVEWKLAKFNRTVEAKYIRLYGVETSDNDGNVANEFMSAAEVRVRNSKKELHGDNTTVSFESNVFDYTGSELKPEPTVTFQGNTLTNGSDYNLSYRNNIEPGTATVAVEGIAGYTGVVEAEFTINPVNEAISDYEQVNVTTEKGVYPELPGTVIANTNIGQKVMEVRWDRIAASRLNKLGTFNLQGTVTETNVQVTAKVTVCDVIGVRQVTLATVKGTVPVMPEKVLVYYSNDEAARRNVEWDLSEASFEEAGTVKITGTVGKSQAEASVRIEEAPAGMSQSTPLSQNFALNEDGISKSKEWPRTFAYVSAANDLAHHATDGVKEFVSDSEKNIWSDWENGVYHTNAQAAVGANDHFPFVASAFGTNGSENSADQKKYTVNKVRIGFMEEDGEGENKIRLPQKYRIEYYSGNNGVIAANRLENGSTGANGGCSGVKTWGSDNPIKAHDGWTEVTYIGGAKEPAVPSADDFKYMVDVEFEPVETTAVRIVLQPQDKNWTGLEEFEVYYEPVVRKDSFTMTAIKVDGADKLSAFTENTLELDAEGGVITAEADNHASITVLEAVNGTAKIIVLPENGDESKKQEYTVVFKKAADLSEKHLVTAEDEMVEIEEGEAAQGETVTFSAKAGYEFKETPVIIKSSDRTETSIAVTKGEDGKYTFTMPDYPVTITGEPVVKTYQITYDLDGGTGTNRETYTTETPDFTLNKPVKEGFIFLGWTGNGVTKPIVDMTVTQGTTGDLAFTANWREGDEYIITFDTDGAGEVASQRVNVASGKITEPELLKKHGYDFVGWFCDEEKTKKWDFAEDTADRDLTLYAKWAEGKITVNTRIAHYIGEAFEMPSELSITIAGETFSTNVTWNKKEAEAVENAADIGSYKVTGTLSDPEGRTLEVLVPVSPAGIIYFLDNGASQFTEQGQSVVDANIEVIQNKDAEGSVIPDGAYSAETGWGYTNPEAEVEANGTGDAYETIRNMTNTDGVTKTLSYQFDNIAAGKYNVTMGFYDPWSEWAGDKRHAKITLTDTAGEELAVKNDHHIAGSNTKVSFEKVVMEADGALTLRIAPKTPDPDDSNRDVMVSFIVIQRIVEKPITEIKVTESSITIEEGEKYQIEASVEPEDA
ncbi:DUF4982 domain-containing protein, partial [Lachnospiraceae bacterium]|nr:DUF4982 domain-containing protein [Lachnospiraceae bacterium]